MRDDQIEDLGQYAEQLDAVVQAEQPVAEFWERLLESYCVLSGAKRAILLVTKKAETQWRKAAYHEREAAVVEIPLAKFQQLAIKAATSAGKPVSAGDGAIVLGVQLRLLTDDNTCVAVFLIEGRGDAAIQSILERLQLVSTAPRVYQMQQSVRASHQDADKFAKVLDLIAPIHEEDRFVAAALTLCNTVATRLECERVSLGWWERGYVRLRAVSRMEKFNRQMAAAQTLETAMDEALEQDAEVLWPAVDASVIARDHEKYAQAEGSGNVLSVPLRGHGEALAVLTCERHDSEFTELEVQQLRLVSDLCAPRLTDLKDRDRWIGARCADGAKRRFASLLGPEHTWAKVLGLGLAVLLAVLIFVKVDYRVESDFILRSDQVAYLTTPFDGYIETVYLEAPATVKEGDLLLTLQTDDLLLQEAAELANVNAYVRQAERARAQNLLADMQIAEAQVKQAEARLAIVRNHLRQAEVRAPFDGVIIEGDLNELLGKPIEKGSPLFKLAQLDKLCVEAKIDERDVHEVSLEQPGEIAFISQPKFKFPVKVTQMEAAAFPEGEGNTFQARCDFTEAVQPWWRPGMMGVCKIKAGKRSLLWIFGHRTVDFFRLWLWW